MAWKTPLPLLPLLIALLVPAASADPAADAGVCVEQYTTPDLFATGCLQAIGDRFWTTYYENEITGADAYEAALALMDSIDLQSSEPFFAAPDVSFDCDEACEESFQSAFDSVTSMYERLETALTKTGMDAAYQALHLFWGVLYQAWLTEQAVVPCGGGPIIDQVGNCLSTEISGVDVDDPQAATPDTGVDGEALVDAAVCLTLGGC